MERGAERQFRRWLSAWSHPDKVPLPARDARRAAPQSSPPWSALVLPAISRKTGRSSIDCEIRCTPYSPCDTDRSPSCTTTAGRHPTTPSVTRGGWQRKSSWRAPDPESAVSSPEAPPPTTQEQQRELSSKPP